jgi:hypothetical protein
MMLCFHDHHHYIIVWFDSNSQCQTKHHLFVFKGERHFIAEAANTPNATSYPAIECSANALDTPRHAGSGCCVLKPAHELQSKRIRTVPATSEVTPQHDSRKKMRGVNCTGIVNAFTI